MVLFTPHSFTIQSCISSQWLLLTGNVLVHFRSKTASEKTIISAMKTKWRRRSKAEKLIKDGTIWIPLLKKGSRVSPLPSTGTVNGLGNSPAFAENTTLLKEHWTHTSTVLARRCMISQKLYFHPNHLLKSQKWCTATRHSYAPIASNDLSIWWQNQPLAQKFIPHNRPPNKMLP